MLPDPRLLRRRRGLPQCGRPHLRRHPNPHRLRGVLVYPGDIAVGDQDGVVIIPRHLADTVATAGLDQERMEAWIRTRIEAGEPLTGLYPPGEAAIAAWRALNP